MILIFEYINIDALMVLSNMRLIIKRKSVYFAALLFAALMILAVGMPNLEKTDNEYETNGKIDETEVFEDVNQTHDIRVEVYHFHATRQCWSCIRLGELAEKTVESRFANEVEGGVLSFAHIDAQKSENREVVKRYGVRGSSLFIGTYIGDEFHKEENIQLWYKLNDEDGYMDILEEIIGRRLGGDLS